MEGMLGAAWNLADGGVPMSVSECAFHTPVKETFLEITGAVAEAVKNSGVRDGICLVFIPHTTAGVMINENADPDVQTDILKAFDQMVPRDVRFDHREGNSRAHIKAMLVGQSIVLPIQEGRLALGTWQGIYFCEFDGPRRRRASIQISGTT